MNDKIKKLADLVAGSNNIVAFTGAGCSTESGIPDFRSRAEKIRSYGTISTEIVP